MIADDKKTCIDDVSEKLIIDNRMITKTIKLCYNRDV